jgi:hypothetical protein
LVLVCASIFQIQGVVHGGNPARKGKSGKALMKNVVVPMLCGVSIGLAPLALFAHEWILAYILVATGITAFFGCCFIEKPNKSDGIGAWVFFIGLTILMGFLWIIFVPLLVAMYVHEAGPADGKNR